MYTQTQQATFKRATLDSQRLSSFKIVVEAYAHGMRNFPLSTILLLPVHSVVHSQLATAVTDRVILAYSLIATIANQPSTASLRALPIYISKEGRALLEYGAAPPRPLTDTHRAQTRTICHRVTWHVSYCGHWQRNWLPTAKKYLFCTTELSTNGE